MDTFSHKLTKAYVSLYKDINLAFEDIATDLLTTCIILKGGMAYRFTDIEFYLYRDVHRDIITYPRNSPAGNWFFHASGVDITFESEIPVPEGKKKPHLTSDAFFGGVLIRGIEKTDSDNQSAFNGPMLACNELFDQFNAFGNVRDFPVIVPGAVANGRAVRLNERKGLNPDVEYKVKSILANNYSGSDISREELMLEYAKYLKAPYHFVLQR